MQSWNRIMGEARMRALARAVAILAVALAISAARTWAASATLGSAPEAFAASFGNPIEDNGPAKSYVKCAATPGEAKWGVVYGITGTLKDGFRHPATAIERHGCGSERLDSPAARKEALGMMPSDAQPVRGFTTADGRHAQEYRSLSLGKALSADKFLGCGADGKMEKVPEGTFSYAPAKDGRSWDIILGTCF
jgi:hypothetical protein